MWLDAFDVASSSRARKPGLRCIDEADEEGNVCGKDVEYLRPMKPSMSQV